MIEYKILLGALAVAIQLTSFSIYFIGIWKGKTKPHAFTWLVWGIINIIAFSAVISSGGESGSWVLAVNAIACLSISFIGFRQKIVSYDLYDWMALIGAFLGIFLWWLTKNPLYAVILVSLSDATSAIPTFRKAYRFPFEENALSFSLGIFYFVIAILALESLSITTWLYPATIVLVDGALVLLILLRRKKLEKRMV